MVGLEVIGVAVHLVRRVEGGNSTALYSDEGCEGTPELPGLKQCAPLIVGEVWAEESQS